MNGGFRFVENLIATNLPMLIVRRYLNAHTAIRVYCQIGGRWPWYVVDGRDKQLWTKEPSLRNPCMYASTYKESIDY